MRAWCVVVPKARGEETRRALRDRGQLLADVPVVRDGDRLFFPTKGRVDLGFPTEEREFAEAVASARTYKDIVQVPDRLRRYLPTAFDVIGDIAVVRIPDELDAHVAAIGDALLRWNPRLRVVARDRGVAGERRVRRIEVLAGEPRTTTWYVEFGLRYHVDVAKAYFSPRLATERARVASQVREGETVADPFAGVGPYAVLIARRRRPAKVVASDANPEAVALLRTNVAVNRADRVEVHEGDGRGILRAIAPVDRAILDLPHSAMEFLPDALDALGPVGTVHLYGILSPLAREDRVTEIRESVARADRRIRDLVMHDVRAYSPTQHHVAFDITVDRA